MQLIQLAIDLLTLWAVALVINLILEVANKGFDQIAELEKAIERLEKLQKQAQQPETITQPELQLPDFWELPIESMPIAEPIKPPTPTLLLLPPCKHLEPDSTSKVKTKKPASKSKTTKTKTTKKAA